MPRALALQHGIVTSKPSQTWLFPQGQLANVARFRQLFESFGYLAPSICLAIVTAVGGFNSTVDTDPGEVSKSFVAVSTHILAFIGMGFCILSCDQIIMSAAKIPQKEEEEEEEETLGIMATIKTFFNTSIVKYFLLNSLLLACSNGDFVAHHRDAFRPRPIIMALVTCSCLSNR